MPPVPDPLDILAESPEEKIVKAYFALVAADADLISIFSRGILLLEQPRLSAVEDFDHWRLLVSTVRIAEEEKPSRRAIIRARILLVAFVPPESSEEASKLRALRLGNKLRTLTFSNTNLTGLGAELDLFEPQPPALSPDGGTSMLSYLVAYRADIEQSTGDFL